MFFRSRTAPRRRFGIDMCTKPLGHNPHNIGRDVKGGGGGVGRKSYIPHGRPLAPFCFLGIQRKIKQKSTSFAFQ